MEDKIVELDDITVGRYLGYPECCIRSFVSFEPGKTHIEQADITKYYTPEQIEIREKGMGFIPCEKDAVRVKNGEIRLEDLIENRHLDLPPFDKAIDFDKAKKLVAGIIEKERKQS